MDTDRNIFIADMHCDTVMQMRRGYDISQRHDTYHIDIPRLKQGGVGLQVFACSLNPFVKDDRPVDTIDAQLDVLHSEIEKNADSLDICHNSAEVRKTIDEGRIAVVAALEGGEPLENDPARVRYFYDRGIRLITIAHQRPPGWCTTWNEPGEETDGLTDLGYQMIEEMNHRGIIVDLSHSSRNTFRKVIEASRAPVVASHSCADSLSPTERNLTDEQIKAIAETGGVIGVSFINFLLTPDFNQPDRKFWENHAVEGEELKSLFVSAIPEEEKEKKWAEHDDLFLQQAKILADVMPSVKTVVEHIDYISNLAGYEHIAIGSDFDGAFPMPHGLEDCSRMPNLIEQLSRRDYSDGDIEKIMGSNFLRVMTEICG